MLKLEEQVFPPERPETLGPASTWKFVCAPRARCRNKRVCAAGGKRRLRFWDRNTWIRRNIKSSRQELLGQKRVQLEAAVRAEVAGVGLEPLPRELKARGHVPVRFLTMVLLPRIVDAVTPALDLCSQEGSPMQEDSWLHSAWVPTAS